MEHLVHLCHGSDIDSMLGDTAIDWHRAASELGQSKRTRDWKRVMVQKLMLHIAPEGHLAKKRRLNTTQTQEADPGSAALESLTRAQRMEAASEVNVQQKMAKLKADHLYVKPVYLGFTDYKNLKGLVSTAAIKDRIVTLFKEMSMAQYQHHPLCEFFERGGNGGYVPKMVHVKAGQTQIMFDVDHVVPKRWGGIDHPRNYVVVHQSMNRSFGDDQAELKMAYYGRSVLRKVAEFTRCAMSSNGVNKALTEFLVDKMDKW